MSSTASGSAAAPPPPSGGGNYYDKGSVELAVETPVMMKRLEKRRNLTGGANEYTGERLLIVLVGLPARGKSFIARKLLHYLRWRSNQCRIFNVGKYRRQLAGQDGDDEDESTSQRNNNSNNNDSQRCNANFFDESNHEATRLRQQAAEVALRETLEWLDGVGSDVSFSVGSDEGLHMDEDDETLEDDTSLINGHESHGVRRQFHRIAIFDATNSTKERRQWILTQCADRKRTGVLFLESICDDPELLAENLRYKISSCPDFGGMSPEEALQDLQIRIQKYESRYEPIDDRTHDSYIKIFNLSSRLQVNHIYGRLAKVVLPAIMAWNTGSRPIFLCRAGETKAMEAFMRQKEHLRRNKNNNNAHDEHVEEKKGNDEGGGDNYGNKFEAMTTVNTMVRRMRGDRLGERGLRFRDALCDFIEQEGIEFMNRRNENVVHPSNMDTGTSISGLYEERDHTFAYEGFKVKKNATASPKPKPSAKRASTTEGSEDLDDNDSASADTTSSSSSAPSFPCLVMSSTMPRAVETATWQKHRFPVKDVSNLNPLDMGDFAGMDLATIRVQHPEWYKQLKREPFHTRFPGGESYSDMIDRLYSIIIDMEQQLGLAVLVSHVSVLQVLVSYFRASPIQDCIDIEIPMHTVLKFTPLRGGGWLESQHALLPDDSPEKSKAEPRGEEPIWGDSRSCLPPNISNPDLMSMV